MRTELLHFYKNKKVLVTGGAGFIGSHLVEALVALGAYVTVLDNFSTGSEENLASVRDQISIIDGDITEYQTCLQATHNSSIIFHLAALISVPESCQNPRACHETNVTGTHNLLEAARQNNTQRFIFSSSAAVYGPHEGLCSETTPCNPCSPYGLSKVMGELYCHQYAQLYELETTVLRYFNVYGDRQKANTGVVAHFRHSLATGVPLTIHGDGMQERDFVPVQTIVTANLLLGSTPRATVNDHIFNIATGTSISLISLVNRLKSQYPDYNHPIRFVPARPGDIRLSAADCTKFHQILADRTSDHSSIFYGILDQNTQEISL